MKNRLIIILSIVFALLVVTGVGLVLLKPDDRQIVWNNLSDKEKDEVNGTWRDAAIEKVNADDVIFAHLPGRSREYYKGRELYRVTFPSKREGVLGPLVVYADTVTKEIVGWGIRL